MFAAKGRGSGGEKRLMRHANRSSENTEVVKDLSRIERRVANIDHTFLLIFEFREINGVKNRFKRSV
ncbi:hypothetical protein [Paraburkholderia unamae]|uniref:hypothetical protein n=1 Tax=Paraburkholderia unamae TaxID=219649 RepID=UPI0011BF3C29|nr:hypothetical protein [Paraburkholderia unamae]